MQITLPQHVMAAIEPGKRHSLSLSLDGNRVTSYLDGVRLDPPGRNATCPCGSGRKFKRCCQHPASDST